MSRQRQNVFGSLTQRRHCHLDHIEPEQEIFAKAPLLYLLFQVAMSGCNHPDIGPAGLIFSDPLELFFLQKAQQLGLQTRRDLAHFIEKQSPPLRTLDPTGLIAHCAGKRSACMSEQLTGKQIFG